MFKLPVLESAERLGWATYTNNDGERFDAFHPILLSEYVEMIRDGLEPPTQQIQVANQQSGFTEENSDTTRERARRATSAIVRDARFGTDVLAAYGNRCAMCGVGLKIVVGAHIYPASAPESPDVVSNGMCLCENHHRAFDRHLIWVEPDHLGIRLHPTLDPATDYEPDRNFVQTTFQQLSTPEVAEHAPNPEMFRRRYAYYENFYTWSQH